MVKVILKFFEVMAILMTVTAFISPKIDNIIDDNELEKILDENQYTLEAIKTIFGNSTLIGILSLIILSLILSIPYFFRKREEINRSEKLSEIYTDLHIAYREYFMALASYQSSEDPGVKERYMVANERFHRRFSDSCARIFETLHDAACSVTFKLLDPGDKKVREEWRDTFQGGARARAHQEPEEGLDYWRNTAFRVIIDDARKGDYARGWLKLRALIPWRHTAPDGTRRWGRLYENANGNWRKFYKTTLVVPVTGQVRAQSIDLRNTYGFLCIDSNTGTLNDKVLLNIARQLSCMYYIVIATMPGDLA